MSSFHAGVMCASLTCMCATTASTNSTSTSNSNSTTRGSSCSSTTDVGRIYLHRCSLVAIAIVPMHRPPS